MNVLICVDESEFAEHIIDYVSSQHWSEDTEFVVLHVVQSLLPVSAVIPIPIQEGLHSELMETGRKLVRHVSDALKEKGFNQTFYEEVIEGDPRSEILDWARRAQCAMIVVGSHGRRGFDRLILGSVSHSVVAAAPCSVVVVRAPRLKQEELKPDSKSIKELAK